MNLKGKKILFISAHFFGYEKAIIERLKKKGAEVDFYNERPSDSLLSKGIIRVNSHWYQRRINRYYRKILLEISTKKYDFFLLIKGESIPFFFLDVFQEKNPLAEKIFYSYDTVDEYPKFEKLYPFFDKNFTFEPRDAKRFGLYFRPLFFIDDYKNIREIKEQKYDITFIGTAHTDRYAIGEKVGEVAERHHLKTFFYYYAPGRTAFLLKRLFDRHLQHFDIKKLSFTKLKHAEIAEIYSQSFSVLDINKPFQNGLTIRTFEALASGKKILTTNSDIKNYPFFSEENVMILDRGNLKINKDFFETQFAEIDEEILSKMSLDSWIECLFLHHQDQYWGIKERNFE